MQRPGWPAVRALIRWHSKRNSSLLSAHTFAPATRAIVWDAEGRPPRVLMRPGRMWVRSRRGVLLGCALAVLIALCFVEPADAAKKKKSKAKKAKPAATAEPARCGVCIAAVDEIFKELAVTENSTSTLDLRWGLTAQVTDGRAKRIGKVIKYNRSQLRAIEVMEKICGEMKQYERYSAVAGEVQLKSRAEIKRLNPDKSSSNPDEEREEKKRDTR